MEAERTETPLDALTRLARHHGQEFVSADPAILDIFAFGYAVDSYFLWDHRSDGFAPDVYDRYRERAVAESFPLDSGARVETHGKLDHLTCCYYRLYVSQHASTCRVTLEAAYRNGRPPQFKVAVAEVTEQGCGDVKPLGRNTSPISTDRVQLSTDLRLKDMDHMVLVIVNCGTQALHPHPDVPHDDNCHYSLTIETD